VVRTHGVDVVPDWIGLGLYATGLWRLSGRSKTLVTAASVSAVAAALALLDLVPGALGSDPAAADFVYNTAVSLAVGTGALGLRARARTAGDTVTGQLLAIVVLTGAGLAAFGTGWATNGADHELALRILLGGRLVSVVVLLWYVVLLITCASRDWAHPNDPADVVPDGSASR
jgi:hypothetical protein